MGAINRILSRPLEGNARFCTRLPQLVVSSEPACCEALVVVTLAGTPCLGSKPRTDHVGGPS
jgi:hypothetical protein